MINKKLEKTFIILGFLLAFLLGMGTMYAWQKYSGFALKLISSPPAEFNLIFKYGHGAKNELNTFNGTYTKDMVSDPSITTNLSLSKEELDRIYEKMVEINFFNYPREFSVPVPPGEKSIWRDGAGHPSVYYFKVKYDSKIKEVGWTNYGDFENNKSKRLKELIDFIIEIIESKEEYKKLPEPEGFYL